LIDSIKQKKLAKTISEANGQGWLGWLWGLCGKKTARQESEALKAKVKEMSQEEQMEMLRGMARDGKGRDAIVGNVKEMCDQVKELRARGVGQGSEDKKTN
jgi:hypothetical protein